MEEQLTLANTELKIKYQKIRLVDEKIKEADYSVKRRRGTLITLQKMDENRTERFGYQKNDKRKVDLYKNVNEGKKKYMEKRKLDFQRKLFEFKKTVNNLEERGLNAQNKAGDQKTRICEVIKKCIIEKEHIKEIL